MAEAPERSSIKIIDSSGVSPPPSSVPASTLPLTYLDIPWLLCRPMKRLFFYDFPHSTPHFIQTIVPSLKRSLSLSLQQFYPFASCIVDPPPPTKPHILYADGDSVPFTAAVSAAATFHEATSNRPQDAALLHPLVPRLPPPWVSDGTRHFPVSAIQVTLFPNAGICIGIQFLHAAADGLSFNHFMKSWASICKKGGDFTCLYKDTYSLPFHNRSVIKDRNNLEPVFLDEWRNWASTWEATNPNPVTDNKVRATFILDTARIDRLKSWLKNHLTDLELHLYNMSTFVVTCAFTWVCLVQSKNCTELESSKLDHFCFVADCRNRLDDDIPKTYFGNCLAICFVPLEKGTLRSKQHGIVEAAKAIARKVKELDEPGALLRDAERWMVEWKKVSEVGDLVTVAGSPRLRVYDTDFGWGKPRASRVVQIDESGCIALSESREESGGVEIGLALSMGAMDAFSLVFENGLRHIFGGNY